MRANLGDVTSILSTCGDVSFGVVSKCDVCICVFKGSDRLAFHNRIALITMHTEREVLSTFVDLLLTEKGRQ